MVFTPTPVFLACANKAIMESVGKPWEACGRGPDSFDCWGFVIWVYSQCGITLPDFSYNPDDNYSDIFGRELRGEPLDPTFYNDPFSIVTFGRNGSASHVGIYHPSGIYYHCADKGGVIGSSHSAICCQLNILNYWYPKCT